jgi:hypothetical protein
VICADYIGSCKSNYHTITPPNKWVKQKQKHNIVQSWASDKPNLTNSKYYRGATPGGVKIRISSPENECILCHWPVVIICLFVRLKYLYYFLFILRSWWCIIVPIGVLGGVDTELNRHHCTHWCVGWCRYRPQQASLYPLVCWVV